MHCVGCYLSHVRHVHLPEMIINVQVPVTVGRSVYVSRSVQCEGQLIIPCVYYMASDWEASPVKGMEHVPNIFMSFDKYLFLEVINILIYIGLFKQSEIELFKKYLKPI